MGTWLSPVDWDIITFLHRTGLELSPKAIHHNSETRARYNSVARRCRRLESAGILERLEDPSGYYNLTETGAAVAESRLSREEVEELEPDD